MTFWHGLVGALPPYEMNSGRLSFVRASIAVSGSRHHISERIPRSAYNVPSPSVCDELLYITSQLLNPSEFLSANDVGFFTDALSEIAKVIYI